MIRKALSAAFISVLLISALAGTVLANVSETYHTDYPAIIRISSPARYGVYSPNNNVPISVSVESPSGWWEMTSVQVELQLDGLMKTRANAKKFDEQGHVFTYNSSLNALKEGRHSLSVVADICYLSHHPVWPVDNFTGSGKSDVVYFFSEAVMISVLLIENKTYNARDLPLDFVVNRPVQKVTYSLDGQANMTIAGNIMLTGLSEGEHNVTVLAWDDGGNIGAYETVFFAVAIAKPEPFPTALVAVSAVVVVAGVVSTGLLVYFRKRKQR